MGCQCMSAKNSHSIPQVEPNRSNSFFKNSFSEENKISKSQRNYRNSKINLKEKSLEKPNNNSKASTLTSFHKNDRLLTKSDKPIAINSQLVVSNNRENVFKQYKIIKKIGEGSYGVVWKVKHKKTNLIRAMKKIKKNNKTNDDTTKDIINEIELLRKLDHPNIVKIFEFFNEPDGYYLITEFCSGGELFDEIKKKKYFPENIAANIMYQIFNAINYCHTFGKIIHRDLKPENILIVNHDEVTGFYRIKIIDFGTAKIYEQNKNENKIIGSSYYIAPEVLHKNYNEKCDIWSVGVILYILLCGRAPFTGHNHNEILSKIKIGNYDLKRKPFDTISIEAKDLIKKCLEMNVNKRISAKEALNHSWFSKNHTKKNFMNIPDYFLQKTIKNIINYKPKNELQELALTYLVHNLPDLYEIQLLNNVFNIFNNSPNSQGKLTKPEIKQALKKYLFKNNKNEHQIEKYSDEIFRHIDIDHNNYIEYEEFARAGIDKNIFRETNVLRFIFDFIDKDHSGEISIDELKEVFKIHSKNGELLLKKLIHSLDQDMNGQISFKEFTDVMIKIIE